MPEPKRMRPTISSGWRIFFGVVGQVEVDHDEAGDADGDVEKEDDAPMEVVDDEAAGDGAEHGGDERGNGDEAHDADEIGLGEGSDQGESAYRDHHGAAHALHDAECDQQMNVGGDAAEKRAQREDADGRGKHAAGSEPVGHPAADGNEDGEAKRVAGEHGLHAERRNAEGFGDGGHGGVENGGVERLHEEGDCNQPWQQAHCGVGGYRCFAAALEVGDELMVFRFE